MTKKDESPEEATNPYWSDELLAVLAEALGDEDRARQHLVASVASQGRFPVATGISLCLYLNCAPEAG